MTSTAPAYTLEDLTSAYLAKKGVPPGELTPAIQSDVDAYISCFKWYRDILNTSQDNAKLAASVWVDKYALHNEDGICLEMTPEATWDRVADTLAKEEILTNPTTKNSLEQWREKFRGILTGWQYTPQGSGLYALGNPYVRASASNCFAVPSPEDSLESIFDTAKAMAKIFAFRGGVGNDLSELRPFGARTNNSAKSSTGAASFMDFYSYVTGMIGQAGRRGASMLSMRVDHPDILRFIRMKRDLDKQDFIQTCADAGIDLQDPKWSAIHDRLKSVSFANVSVKLTRAFIQAVREDGPFTLWFDFKGAEYPRIEQTIRAREIWDELIQGAWESAEPGIFNWDLLLEESPADCYLNLTNVEVQDPQTGNRVVDYSFRTLTTNPCGEVPLSAWDSCCLGVLNLPLFVINPYTPEATFDTKRFKEVVTLATRAQDNIKNWDLRVLPLPGNRDAGYLGRRISLGGMGLGDVIAMLGIRYDSPEALDVADHIYGTLKNATYASSVQLAKEKGAFPVWDWEKEKDNPFLNRLDPKVLEDMKKYGRRNIACLTNAPTGSMAILARNCTSGIEPVFMKSYTRNVKIPGTNDFTQYQVNHQGVQDCLDAGGNPDVYVEAGLIDPEMRIRLQATIQKHIDHSISVTTNLKEATTKEQVSDLYMKAFELGCKGMTVYREGSRTGVLVSNDAKTKKAKGPVERPKTTQVNIHKVPYKSKPWAILVGTVDGRPIEVFAGIEEDAPLPNKYHSATLTKKSRGHYTLEVLLSEDSDDVVKINNVGARFPAPEGMALTRFISLGLRNGISMSDLVEQLQKSASSMFDYPAVLAKVLKTYISEEEMQAKIEGKPCPECGKGLKVRKQDGCMVEYCDTCTYINAKCG